MMHDEIKVLCPCKRSKSSCFVHLQKFSKGRVFGLSSVLISPSVDVVVAVVAFLVKRSYHFVSVPETNLESRGRHEILLRRD